MSSQTHFTIDGVTFRFAFHEQKFYTAYWSDGYAYDDNWERFISTLLIKSKVSPSKLKKTALKYFNKID